MGSKTGPATSLDYLIFTILKDSITKILFLVLDGYSSRRSQTGKSKDDLIGEGRCHFVSESVSRPVIGHSPQILCSDWSKLIPYPVPVS